MMAARKLYDLAVKTGWYQNNQGEQKNRYENVGAVMEGDNGKFLFIKKTFNPAGVTSNGESIIVSMFEPRENNKQQQGGQPPPQQNNQQPPPQQNNDGFDSDIPF